MVVLGMGRLMGEGLVGGELGIEVLVGSMDGK